MSLFFFSSRRRHTSCGRDWSSDVCSSDLDAPLDFDFIKVTEQSRDNAVFYVQYAHARAWSVFRNTQNVFPDFDPRSEERRVGKECRNRWWQDHKNRNSINNNMSRSIMMIR